VIWLEEIKTVLLEDRAPTRRTQSGGRVDTGSVVARFKNQKEEATLEKGHDKSVIF